MDITQKGEALAIICGGRKMSLQSSSASSKSLSFLMKTAWSMEIGGLKKIDSLSDIQPGDIILFDISSFPGFSKFKHAALCYKKHQLAHFEGKEAKPYGSVKGKISIEEIHSLQDSYGAFEIWRFEKDISEETIMNRVDEMMKYPTIFYNFYYNNCIHFALCVMDESNYYCEKVKRVKKKGAYEAVKGVEEEGDHKEDPLESHDNTFEDIKKKLEEKSLW